MHNLCHTRWTERDDALATFIDNYINLTLIWVGFLGVHFEGGGGGGGVIQISLKSAFFGKNSTFTQINSVIAVLKTF